MTPPTILVVDDEHDLAITCQRLLRRQGWSVAIAHDRRSALELLAGPPPPVLAIVDRQLPDGDGLDVVRAAVAASIPAVLASGVGAPLTRQLAQQEGAAAFLAKPFTALELQQLVERLVGEAAPRAPMTRPPPAPGPPGKGLHC
jgi:CheY-like chemotaxis protein